MLPNLHQVDERLWRGGRPQVLSDYDWLEAHCKSIVNLEGDDMAAKEFQAIRDTKLDFLWFPINPFELYVDAPPLDLLDYLVAWIDKLSPMVYIHCQHGQDRTGLVVAAYRMAHGWSFDDAYREALEHGYRHWLNGGLNHVFECLKSRKTNTTNQNGG